MKMNYVLNAPSNRNVFRFFFAFFISLSSPKPL